MRLEETVLDNSRRSRLDVLANRWQLEAMPQSVYVDVSNRCNCRCVICPYHWTDQDMMKGPIMPRETFLAVGRELFPTARVVYLFGGGEVFLHPDWDELFDFARRWSFLPIISTNGMLFNERRIRALVAAGSHLRISLDGADRETFNRIRQGADFDRVVSNVKRLVACKQQFPADHRFSLRFSVTVFDQNVRQATRIVELAGDLGVEQVVFQHLMVDRNPLAGHEPCHFPELADEMLTGAVERGAELGVHVRTPPPFQSTGVWAERYAEACRQVPGDRLARYFHFPLGPGRGFTCRVPWVETWIKPNGEVAPCCMIAEEHSLGSVAAGGFRELWNGRLYRRFRGRVNSARPPSPCTPRACPFRKHQVDQGRLRVAADGAVYPDSMCPGLLRARIRPSRVRFEGARLRARLAVTNIGDTIWLADEPGASDIGRVRLGGKVLGADGPLPEQHSFRVCLAGNVAPGGETELEIDHQLPPVADEVLLDMVDEGIAWFETMGSEPLKLRYSGHRL